MAWFAWSQASMTLGYVCELMSSTIDYKIVWDNFQFLGMLFAPQFILLFAQDYIGKHWRYHKLIHSLLVVVTLFFLFLVTTDPLHNLIRPTSWPIYGDHFDELAYNFTVIFWIMAIYANCLTAYGLYLLAKRFLQTGNLYRKQVGTILIGVLIPIFSTILTMFDIQFTFHRDTTPFTFAIGNLFIAWGLFHYQLLDIVPIARAVVNENLNDAVIVLDTKNRILDANSIAREIVKRNNRNIIGRQAEHVFAKWPFLYEQFNKANSDRIEVNIDDGGRIRYFEFLNSPIYDRLSQLKGHAIVIHDITERKIAENEIQEWSNQLKFTNDRLQFLTKAKDQFVSKVSHELRTPITNIKLYLDLLENHPEQKDTYLDTLYRETDRLTNMIDGLLILSRLDQDCFDDQIKPCDLNTIVKDIICDRSKLANERQLILDMQLENNLVRVKADRCLREQVISILITNALNYTPTGGKIIIKTENREKLNQQWGSYIIKDTGPGISPEEQEKLFSRFFRGKTGLESKLPGTGLGLAIAKEIIDRHKGEIEVQSTGINGDGTQFLFCLPAVNQFEC